MKGEQILVCEYCRGPVTTPYEYRPRPDDPPHVFCSPPCRDDFVDGYGDEHETWPAP